MDLTGEQALALRTRSLLLGADPGTKRPTDVAGLVAWFGAMQSQDLASGLWSLGVRLPGLTQTDVEAALERREALRTWPMRGTVHLVPARDARWMVRLLGERPLAGAAARREHLGLSTADADRAVDLLTAALAGGGRLTRAECIDVLERGGLSGAGQRGYHLLWYASQRGVTCIAPQRGKEQTFVLLDEWVPDPATPDRDEALATIAHRYFRSHGPTTRQDFAGWTGLTAVDAKAAIALCGDRLATVQVDGRENVLAPEVLEPPAGESGSGRQWWALPGFDEYLLGFKDRSLMLADEHKQAIIPGGNGIFQSTLVRDGRVVGTWKRSLTTKAVRVEAVALARLTKADRSNAEQALQPYARFVDRLLELRWG